MFERSLLETQRTHRWTAIVSLTLQCSIAAALLSIPLLHPASLVFHNDAPKLFILLRPAPPPIRVKTATPASAPTASLAAPAGRLLTLIPHQGPATSDTPPSASLVAGLGSGSADSPGLDAVTSSGSAGLKIAVIPPRPSAPVRISQGVSAGLLLSPIRPIYPRMAIATRTEGVVVVDAVISKSGKIESAHATSGPPLLREAALDAVRNARYSPYLLNGTTTEVQTTITVTFRLGN